MPRTKRAKKTKYPGVYVVDGTSPADGKPETVYYIVYRKDGKLIEEKAGRARPQIKARGILHVWRKE